jgi:hypothetical protein
MGDLVVVTPCLPRPAEALVEPLMLEEPVIEPPQK